MDSDSDDEAVQQYVCGDCGRLRDEENIDMVDHEEEERGAFPICTDTDCSIENTGQF